MAAIIYANTLVFDGNCPVDNCLQVIANWLNDKTGGRFSVASLGRKNLLLFPKRQQVQIWASTETYPHMFAFRYSHFDEKLFGRQWITEIGLRREFDTSNIECSVLLRTEDDSPNAIIPEVTRPNLVRKLIDSCSLIPEIDALSLKRSTIIDEDIVGGLRAFVIDSPERRRPLVIVSSTASGEYLLNTERLSDLLGGLASVLVIPVGFNTYRMEEQVGERYTAYNGAISIIFPSREVRGSRVVPTKKLMAEELLEALPGRRETTVLAAVTRRTNSSSYSQHISSEMVNELDLRRRIIKKREEATEQGARTKELDDLWEEYETLDHEKSKIDAKLAASEDDNVTLNLLLDEKQQEKEDAERKLKYIESQTKQLPDTEIIAIDDQISLISKVVNSFGEKITLEDSLVIIKQLFPERVVILESAWKSTKVAKKFRHQQKAFNLLINLATGFWQSKVEGKTDKGAGILFGESFSVWESEKIVDNKQAHDERTFVYDGHPILMLNHLKIGTKESDVETLRIHFDWDADKQVIVIGHCGKHLFVPK